MGERESGEEEKGRGNLGRGLLQGMGPKISLKRLFWSGARRGGAAPQAGYLLGAHLPLPPPQHSLPRLPWTHHAGG